MLRPGDMVRWSSSIVSGNSHLALQGEVGVVVSINLERRTADVVWHDGERGTYPLIKLAATIGNASSVSRSVGEKRTPLRDYGHKPVPVPPRVKYATVTHSPDTCWFVAEAYEKKIFFDVPSTKKPGETEQAMVKHFTVEVRARHWDANVPSVKFVTGPNFRNITYSNGEKVSLTPTGGKTVIRERFGDEMANTVGGMLGLGERKQGKGRWYA